MNWFKNYLDPYSIKDEKNYIWLALWNNSNSPNVTFPVDLWQYTSDGYVEGIEGRVDMDISYIEDYPQNNPQPVQKTNEELANEVIAGKWGNGEERKRRLTEAGYNYEEVQRLVNEKYGIYDRYYIVKSGDNLTSIAKKFGTTWQKIYEDNKNIIGDNPNLIYAGQKLVIK